jgi:hypothetical protein
MCRWPRKKGRPPYLKHFDSRSARCENKGPSWAQGWPKNGPIMDPWGPKHGLNMGPSWAHGHSSLLVTTVSNSNSRSSCTSSTSNVLCCTRAMKRVLSRLPSSGIVRDSSRRAKHKSAAMAAVGVNKLQMSTCADNSALQLHNRKSARTKAKSNALSEASVSSQAVGRKSPSPNAATAPPKEAPGHWSPRDHGQTREVHPMGATPPRLEGGFWVLLLG